MRISHNFYLPFFSLQQKRVFLCTSKISNSDIFFIHAKSSIMVIIIWKLKSIWSIDIFYYFLLFQPTIETSDIKHLSKETKKTSWLFDVYVTVFCICIPEKIVLGLFFHHCFLTIPSYINIWRHVVYWAL